jgi:Trypsin-like peptidase domain
LITNWHVVTNKDPNTRDWIKDRKKESPNRIEIVHNSKKLGEYKSVYETLIDKSGKATFVEFPLRRGSKEVIDVAAVPLTDTVGISLHPIVYSAQVDSILLQPTDRLFVLGFPKGLKSTPFMPIWKSGLIASEPDVDQEGKPIVWLDIEAFPGMSGSPVYLITDKLLYKDGSSRWMLDTKSFFIGVFSHDRGSNVGAVWKSKYLKKLFSNLE